MKSITVNETVMKATIDVKKGYYSQFNGETFEVNMDKAYPDKFGKLVFPIEGLYPENPDRTVDFTQDELFFSK